MGTPSTPRPSSAVALVLAAALCFTAIDTAIKYLALRYSVPLLVWARWGVPALLMVVFLGWRMRAGLLRTSSPRLQIARGAVLTVSSLCFFTALKFLPLAEATGLNYSTPMLVTLMAGWVLRERISRPRWLFVAVGFAGTMLILRPGGAILHVAALFALGAAALNATFQILTRRLAKEDLVVLIFYPSLVGAGLMSIVAPFVFYDAAFRAWDVLVFLGIGVVGLLGHLLFVQAFQRAPASMIAPYTYMQLVWSTLAGWLAFDTFPDAWALTGMVVIASSAVAVTWYERWRASIAAFAVEGAPSPQTPIMMSFSGVGFTEHQLLGSAELASGVSELRVGESAEIPSAIGPPTIVVKTD